LPQPPADRPRPGVAGVVLAAGRGTRFGGAKVRARLGGRSLLEHVLQAARDARVDPIVVVLGDDHDEIEASVAWRDERRVVNPYPERGLASSLRVGIDALAGTPDVDAAVVLLGDQPLVEPHVIRALVDRFASFDADAGKAFVVPHYAGGGGATRSSSPGAASRA
jgi:molybdenum cofactor cytidylyltransferase